MGNTFKNKINGLRVGYDGKRAVCNYTGIGNYSRYVINAMSLLYPKNEYFIYSPKYRDNAQLSPLVERSNVELKIADKPWRKFGSIWRSLEMTRIMCDDSISVVHGLSNELPMNIDRAGIPSIVTIHDLIWRHIPQNYSAADRLIYDFKYKRSAQKATKIIAISQCTKTDLINEFDIDPDKIEVIYQGCDPIFSQKRDKEIAQKVKERYRLPDNYILCVGTVEYRKNQLQAVRSLAGLPKDVSLVIVGNAHKSYYKQIMEYVRKNHLEDRVLWLRNTPTPDLPYLYALAKMTSYTSRYEGFGLPIIESLTVGTPVVAATGSCLEEAGGNGAIYIDPDDDEQYISAATKLITDTYYHNKYSAAGLQHVKKFNMATFAKQTYDLYLSSIFSHFQ